MVESGTLPPLENDGEGEDKRVSNHKIGYIGANLPGRGPGLPMKYTYRFFNKERSDEFKAWTVSQEWREVYEAEDSNSKARAYQATINSGLDKFFPWKTTTRNSNDPPWINAAIKKEGKATQGHLSP